VYRIAIRIVAIDAACRELATFAGAAPEKH
jgi:hypothetical protein